ncbi:MAG: hypothetical protein QOH70_1016 [Blastocatellia bacterium]|jgi:hypothetical protein|nr:hypothetical protein [Blastocatellia bacterium]
MCPNEQNISLLWSFQVLCDAGFYKHLVPSGLEIRRSIKQTLLLREL